MPLARELGDLDDRLSSLGEFSSIVLPTYNSDYQEVQEDLLPVISTVCLSRCY